MLIKINKEINSSGDKILYVLMLQLYKYRTDWDNLKKFPLL
jgi:hypothetical protein